MATDRDEPSKPHALPQVVRALHRYGADDFAAIADLEQKAEALAWEEEMGDQRSRIVADWSRVHRRAKELQAKLAPTSLSPTAMSEWQKWRAMKLVPGPEMRRGIDASRRIAPEAVDFEDRMHPVLLKHANVPLGAANHMTMPEYWAVLDIAAESVEQAAYPGTADARKRYALALRRRARQMRDDDASDWRSHGHALQSVIRTLRLSLDDGTLGLWESSQALIDFAGRRSDGTSQSVEQVTNAAWHVIWEYIVVSRLRLACPSRFADSPDRREYLVDLNGRLLNEDGQPLAWIWDGFGSGALNGDAAPNPATKDDVKALMDRTGVTRLFSSPDWKNEYEKSDEYRAFVKERASLEEGTRATAFEALADIIERPLRGWAVGQTPLLARCQMNETGELGEHSMTAYPNRHSLMGMFNMAGGIIWQGRVAAELSDEFEKDYFAISFSLSGRRSDKAALKLIAERLTSNKVTWLRPAAHPLGRWIIELDAIKKEFDFLQKLDWLGGRVLVRPRHEVIANTSLGIGGGEFGGMSAREDTLVQFLYPLDDEQWVTMPIPPEIQPYLERFRGDHPDPAKCAFVMTRFADTPAHKAIFQAIRETCAKFGIEALRADGKEYADELWPNIRTYMHGCGIGIVIFERLMQNDFNPNVSLEAGYMMALGKPVCLLKDSTLQQLHTDLVGKLYRSINTQNAAGSVPKALEAWLHERSIVVK